jgi:hypothetical protein
MAPSSVVHTGAVFASVNNELFFFCSGYFPQRKPTWKFDCCLFCTCVQHIPRLKRFILLGRMLYLSSHTTHCFQPLVRSIFRPLETHYSEAVTRWMYSRHDRNITWLEFRVNFRKLPQIKRTIAGFEETELCPLIMHWRAVKDTKPSVPRPSTVPSTSNVRNSTTTTPSNSPSKALHDVCSVPVTTEQIARTITELSFWCIRKTGCEEENNLRRQEI